MASKLNMVHLMFTTKPSIIDFKQNATMCLIQANLMITRINPICLMQTLNFFKLRKKFIIVKKNDIDMFSENLRLYWIDCKKRIEK